jgi:PAS domain S-box-containing protein
MPETGGADPVDLPDCQHKMGSDAEGTGRTVSRGPKIMSKTSGSLNRKLTLMLYGVLTLTSLLFLALLFGAYQIQLRNERAHVSSQLNLLFGATLENAMLKRDIDGLQEVMTRLAEQPEVVDVAIVNPHGEIRFSSDASRTGEKFGQSMADLCEGCEGDFDNARITTRFLAQDDGGRILRSINPVLNKPKCAGCHGDPAEHPLNGLLVVDYDAEPMLQKARSSLLFLLFAGFVVMLLTLGTVWWFIRRHVLVPVSELENACQHLSQGNLTYRPEIDSDDEFGSLSRNFSLMAQRLENSLTQLLEKESYLQALIDAVPDGIRVIDENFITVNANTAYDDMLGIERGASIGQHCYRTSYGRDEPCPPTLITCPVHEIGRHPTPIKTMHDYVAADGSIVKVQVFAAPMVVEVGGETRRFVVESIRDLMKDIHFSHEHKLSALGQLAAGVGHEIRNPLSSIRLALSNVLKKLRDNPHIDAQSIDYLDLVDGEIDKCLDISTRLLKMSSLPGETSQLIDLHTAIRETVSLVHYEGEKLGIDIVLSFAEISARVIATETDLRMVVLNLVQNAFHAMPEGGRLEISTRLAGHVVEIDFSDTGEGIAADDLPHIFEPFFSHRADHKKGIGLGLTICQSLVNRYQGTITVVQPRAGFRTCFRVTLPAVGEE